MTSLVFLSYINANILIGLVVLQLLAVYLFFYYPRWQTNIAFIVAVLSFLFFNFTMLEPIESAHERAHDFVVSIEHERLREKLPLVFYKERADGVAIKYLINMPKPCKPLFIDQEENLLNVKSAFFITNDRDFQQLSPFILKHFQVLATDRIGHARMIVFKRK